jgi:tRNA A-37 threonylcarbamoyl transferase component Bud32
MEFIHGTTLRDLLCNTRLNNRQIASYTSQTAAALAEIHSRGICHRDVKPENLIRLAAALGCNYRCGQINKKKAVAECSIRILAADHAFGCCLRPVRLSSPLHSFKQCC